MDNSDSILKKPEVSVIILTYNQEKYVAQCINSVLGQVSEYSIEIILSDDQSSDGTQNIIRQFAEQNPDIIRFNFNENNLGIIKNYLKALDLCKGKYLCLIGGDDYWIDQYKIQKQVDYLEFNPEYGLVYTDYNILNERSGNIKEGCIVSSGKNPIEGDAAHLLYLGSNQIMSLTICIRSQYLNETYKKIMDDNGFLAEDYPTFFWISMHSKIHYMSHITAVYRVHKNSFTNSNNKIQIWKFARSHVYMRKKLMNYFNYKPDDIEETNAIINRKLMRLSLKTNEGKNIAIVAYKSLKLNKKTELEDYITYIGLKYSHTSLVIRFILLIWKNIHKNTNII